MTSDFRVGKGSKKGQVRKVLNEAKQWEKNSFPVFCGIFVILMNHRKGDFPTTHFNNKFSSSYQEEC